MKDEWKGWGPVAGSRKWHYFVDGESLCRKAMLFSRSVQLEDANHGSPDNCAACKRKREKITEDTP